MVRIQSKIPIPSDGTGKNSPSNSWAFPPPTLWAGKVLPMLAVTKQLMFDGMSRNGSWSGKQLRVLGVKDYLHEPGWRRRLEGTIITEQQKNEFLALKNAHLNRKIPHFNEPRLF